MPVPVFSRLKARASISLSLSHCLRVALFSLSLSLSLSMSMDFFARVLPRSFLRRLYVQAARARARALFFSPFFELLPLPLDFYLSLSLPASAFVWGRLSYRTRAVIASILTSSETAYVYIYKRHSSALCPPRVIEPLLHARCTRKPRFFMISTSWRILNVLVKKTFFRTPAAVGCIFFFFRTAHC